MSEERLLMIGQFGVTRTNGWTGWAIRLITRSSVNHAFLYVGGGAVVEARPSGAGYASVAAYPDAIWSEMDLQGKGPAIADAARALVGTPYSWIDCLCIGLADLFGWHVPGPVRDRLTSKRHLMCSQTVDLAYHEAGIELFNDGRIPGDVMQAIQRDYLPLWPQSPCRECGRDAVVTIDGSDFCEGHAMSVGMREDEAAS